MGQLLAPVGATHVPPDAAYLGDQALDAIYQGVEKVWPFAAPALPTYRYQRVQSASWTPGQGVFSLQVGDARIPINKTDGNGVSLPQPVQNQDYMQVWTTAGALVESKLVTTSLNRDADRWELRFGSAWTRLVDLEYYDLKFDTVAVPSTYESFESGTWPADMIRGLTPTIVSDYASQGTYSMQTRGNDDNGYWYGTSSRFFWQELDYEIVLNINPDASTTREIHNVAFWCSKAGSAGLVAPDSRLVDGFMFRVDPGASGGHDFYQVNNGGHGGALAGKTSSGAQFLSRGVWIRLRFSSVGNTVTVVTEYLNGTFIRQDSLDLTPYMNANHPAMGWVGQKNDGAGSTIGTRVDMIKLNV